MSARRLKTKNLEGTTQNKRSQLKPSKSQLKSELLYFFVTLFRVEKDVPVGFQVLKYTYKRRKWSFGIFKNCMC